MYHSVRIVSRPSPIIVPQVITLGSPRPRNASPASVRMADATMTEIITITGGNAFGRMWRNMMRPWPIPIAMQDCTNSRWRRPAELAAH